LVSGELDTKAGGPAEDGNGFRRSIYTMKKRNSPNELLRALDMPAGFVSVSERQSTTTPTQALQLLNGDWVLSRSRKLASHVQRVEDAWLAVFGRPPTVEERGAVQAFLEMRSSRSPRENVVSDLREQRSEAGQFKINSRHERILVNNAEKEGDEFTIEALVKLDTIDGNAELRTLVSRWDGGKSSLESLGWSIDVTGKKSFYKPRNILMQLVGQDENANIGYQVVPSNIHIELGRRYHIGVRISSRNHRVTFSVRDLDNPDGALQQSVVPIPSLSKISEGTSPIVIGGLSKRMVNRQWDGSIEALRVVAGHVSDDLLNADSKRWDQGLLIWRAADQASPGFVWNGSDSKEAESKDPFLQAMNDVCQMLLNTNEFFYIH